MTYFMLFVLCACSAANLILNSFMIAGLHLVTAPGQLLSGLGEWVENNSPQWVHKPLLSCMLCMSSVWGTVWWAVLSQVIELPLQITLTMWPVYVLALAGINGTLAALLFPDQEDELLVTGEDHNVELQFGTTCPICGGEGWVPSQYHSGNEVCNLCKGEGKY